MARLIGLAVVVGLLALPAGAGRAPEAAFSERPAGTLVFAFGSNRLVAVDVATGRRRVRRISSVAACAPQMHVTGGRTAMVGVREMTVRTVELRRESEGEIDLGAAFSPDGAHLAVPLRSGSRWSVAMADTSTGRTTSVPGSSGAHYPELNWAASSGWLFARTGPRRLLAYRPGMSGPRRCPSGRRAARRASSRADARRLDVRAGSTTGRGCDADTVLGAVLDGLTHGIAFRSTLASIGVAAGLALASSPASAAPRPAFEPTPPRLLPGDARAASTGNARPGSWLVGARPGRDSARIARRFAAQRLMPGTGMYRVRADRARGFARALRAHGSYRFSEPDTYALRRQSPADPLTALQWGLPAIGVSSLTPPPVGPESPLLGIMEAGVDTSHPDMQGVTLSGRTYTDPEGIFHGTSVTSVASAPANGVGITGVWPGARTLVATAGLSCGSTVAALYRAEDAGARVINMSYGFPGGACFSHFVATQRLYGYGVVLVASAGNEFESGNPSDGIPATSPHVITVAALNPDLSSAQFSNRNYAVDVAAPGAGVLAAVPPWLDEDGVQDGYQAVDGTSFAAPMVAAAAAWVIQERPSLDHTQITDLVRYSTRDLGPSGYDPDFGFGVFDLPTALTSTALDPDPLEPNDDVGWINGRYFSNKDAPIYRGGRASVSGRLDTLEDPADTFRAIIPGRRTVWIKAKPEYGDPMLEAYNGWVRTVYARRGRIARSDRRGTRSDEVGVTNPYRRPLTIYVVVSANRSWDTGYRLTLRTTR